jgi:hypothetical protein
MHFLFHYEEGIKTAHFNIRTKTGYKGITFGQFFCIEIMTVIEH